VPRLVIRRLLSQSPDDTRAIARELASRLPPAAVVWLTGPLGSGKTVFVKGLAEGLGIDPAEVTSPTFTLIHEHQGARRLYHLDLYRVASGAEVLELGLEELPSPESMLVIEWADRFAEALPSREAVRVTITDRGNDTREIVIEEDRRDLTVRSKEEPSTG
jgi:tRNA threonylcarbamoyladenosine biosynthesis protein TsaE